MPVVDYATYNKMLEHAYKNHYAFPAINVASIESANGALKAFAEAKSDGIIQVSKGGASHFSGSGVSDSALGAMSLANHIHLVAERYNVNIALHTDHCKASELDTFVMPLIAETERRRARGEKNLFSSHMFDGSDIPLNENIKISTKLLESCAANDIILEVESGVVGGEEDGVNNEGVAREKLYTTPEDMLALYEALSKIPNASFMLAATFGNVHGVYKPGNVKLRPKVLLEGKEALQKAYGKDAYFRYVFHGGSGSSQEEIHETLEYGVIKMNIDTDTQYAFTRPIVDHMFKNYDGVLKIESEVGVKKLYDPRSYLKKAEAGIAKRIMQACDDLKSTGNTIFGK